MAPPNDILSDPDIAQAYEDVRSDKSETTWLVLKYASATSDSLKLDKTGTGEIDEMCQTLGDDEAAYAYVRMKLGNDEYSERTKFCFVVWAGKYYASIDCASGQGKRVLSSITVELILLSQVHRQGSCGKLR